MSCYYLQQIAPGSVSGFVIDSDYKSISTLMDLPVVSTAEAIAVFPPETSDMLIAVGYSDMRNRELVINRIASEGYTFTNLIH